MVMADTMTMTMGLEVEKVRENNRMLCFVHIATGSGDGGDPEMRDDGGDNTYLWYTLSRGGNNSLPHIKKYL